MGEMKRWAQNCLRLFKLSKSVNGKESIPAQFFKVPEEEYGIEPPPPPLQRTDYPQKVFQNVCERAQLFPPCWQEAILPIAAWLAIIPGGPTARQSCK